MSFLRSHVYRLSRLRRREYWKHAAHHLQQWLGVFCAGRISRALDLTITYGLRWEYFGPLSEKNNLLFNFPGPFSATSQLVQVGTNGLGGAYKRDLNNFGPRLAVAWNPFQNTVVRAGYGIYYDYIPQDLMIANYTTVAGIATNPLGPQAVLPLGFNQGAWNGSATGPVFSAEASGPTIFVTTHNLATPYVGEWNLNIQQQVFRGAAIEIGYVGSKGTRLTRLYDANQDGINPNYGEIDTFATNSDSTYHALQVQARFSNWRHASGFSAYVFSNLWMALQTALISTSPLPLFRKTDD